MKIHFLTFLFLVIANTALATDRKFEACEATLAADYSQAIAQLARGYLNLEKIKTDGSAPKVVHTAALRQLERAKKELIEALGEEAFQQAFNASVTSQSNQSVSERRIRQTRRQQTLVDEKKLQTFRFKYKIPAHEVVVTKDGTRFFSASALKNMLLRDFTTGKVLQGFETGNQSYGIQLSPTEDVVGHLSVSNELTIWDAKTGDSIYQISGGELTSFDFSHDDKMFAFESENKKLQFLKTTDGSLIGALDIEAHIPIMGFNYDSSLFITQTQGALALQVWDVVTRKSIFNFNSADDIISAKWQPGGNKVLVRDSENSFAIWSPQVEETKYFEDYDNPQWSHDGKLFVANRTAKNLNIWQASDLNAPPVEIKTGRYMLQTAKFSPDLSQLAAICTDERIRIWDIETGLVVDEIEGKFETLDWGDGGNGLIAVSVDQSDPYQAHIYERDGVLKDE